jgi:hypothetical protein
VVPKYESWNCDGVLVLVKNGEARDDFLFPQVACRRYCGGCSMVNGLGETQVMIVIPSSK